MLRKVELVRGIILFVTVAFPWYTAMLVKHGREYIDRFFEEAADDREKLLKRFGKDCVGRD